MDHKSFQNFQEQPSPVASFITYTGKMEDLASRPLKKRRLTPPDSNDDTKTQKFFFKNAASWNLEQDYENRSKKGKKNKKESQRLPIKTLDGRIEQLEEDDIVSVQSDAEWLDCEGEDENESAPLAEILGEPQIPERELVRKAQEELAKIATQLNEEPEEHPGAFKALVRIGESSSLAVQKLALLTSFVVYRDVIPGYRIRPASDEPGEQVSKEVKKLRSYETSLVSGYQNYLQKLAHLASCPPSGKKADDLASVAITAACGLINSVPHFNFRDDLLRILVRKLSSRKADEGFEKCRQALETLFAEDEQGRASMEAVSLLTKMMKAHEYRVNESVLNLFLHLRLLSEFSRKASNDRATRVNGDDTASRKKDRNFRTKKERKRLKEQKAADKIMAQADALVSHEERDQMQSETLKMVFATYFRILKTRSPHLMGVVLEGLAKYAHLINQDFFGDLLEALKDLIRDSERKGDQDEEADKAETDDGKVEIVRDTNREALLCTVTAFALLAGQDAHNARGDLHLDLTFFTTHLFQSLLSVSVDPDLELGAKSLRLDDPSDLFSHRRRDNKVNLETTTVLLLRCLKGVLLPPWNIRSVPPLRLAAFAKQLMSASLQVPEKSSQAVLGTLLDVAHTHGKKISALWNAEERRGDGSFNPFSATVEGSNPFCTSVFEKFLLEKHYCPKVREGVRLLDKSIANS